VNVTAFSVFALDSVCILAGASAEFTFTKSISCIAVGRPRQRIADHQSLAGLSDDFNGTQLDPSWTVLNAPLLQIAVSGGALHLQAIPGQDGVWFQGSTKTLVYKLVTASNFKVTTTARPRKRTDPTTPPTNPLHVGGLMVRNPSSSGGTTENYLFIMVGSNEGAMPGVEVKSTTNGSSVFAEPGWSNPAAADLRICRLGSSFYVFKRVPGTTTWQSGRSNESRPDPAESRPDLPQTLQVGLALNYSGGVNDLNVGFDNIIFSADTPLTFADCISDLPASAPVPASSPAVPFVLGAALLLAGAVTVAARARGHDRALIAVIRPRAIRDAARPLE